VATDPRLADPVILALAARRAKERQQAQPPPGRKMVLRVVYDNPFGEPPLPDEEYVYDVPETGPAGKAEPC
jgi:hypothetical protein